MVASSALSAVVRPPLISIGRARSTIAGIWLLAAGTDSALMASQARAQSADLPAAVTAGLDAYRSRGAAAAVRAWLSGSAAISDSNVIHGTMAALERIRAAYGALVGHELLLYSPVGSRAARYHVVLFHEKGPLYMYFDTYRASEKLLITGFQFNTNPEAILPGTLLQGRR